jgi:signal transduction histidine kinase
VLTNLLSNAVKFSRTCDRIEVVGGEDEQWTSLTVRNTGSHIDAEDLERIFDRFYRGGNAQRDAVAGTGIGLSVARDIVAAHGGTLTADEVDDGASFTVCLPRE